MIKRDNKEVAQDGVESTASQLQGGGGGWLAKWTKQRGHGTSKSREQKSALVDIGAVVLNSPDEEIYEQIETNEIYKFSISAEK